MLKLKVEEMSCGHCVKAVTEAASSVNDVEKVEVDLAGGLVTVSGHPDSAAVIAALDEAGYPAQQVG
ncbi:heavy metal transporter [Thalassospira profundimaris]|uniref:Heavy metal transporter n=1 Tax=Thalassospira profundimaris TaxID=502049 RepID=A0A367XC09_9PROT|nr:heavy-metal-associated domain-containing protein [Thalassospira profundimaris]RCK51203.1 heavy metal transporter [Thalassospira profundimaris]